MAAFSKSDPMTPMNGLGLPNMASSDSSGALCRGRYSMDLLPPASPDPPPKSSVADRPYVPEISRERIIELVADMNRVGFGVLSGYLEPADLEDLRQFVETAVAAAGGEYVVFTGEEAVAGTLLDELSASPPL
jgi:hypothetical protein